MSSACLSACLSFQLLTWHGLVCRLPWTRCCYRRWRNCPGHDGSVWATSSGFNVGGGRARKGLPSAVTPIRRSVLAEFYRSLARHDSLTTTLFHTQVKADEAKALAAAYKDATAIRAKGLMLGGEKYIALRADDRSVYGKKGSGGVITGRSLCLGAMCAVRS